MSGTLRLPATSRVHALARACKRGGLARTCPGPDNSSSSMITVRRVPLEALDVQILDRTVPQAGHCDNLLGGRTQAKVISGFSLFT